MINNMGEKSIKGYKAFYKGLVNKYGFKYEEGKIYTIDGNIKYGEDGNGFHFCKRLEDTYRYFSEEEQELVFTEVTGYGKIDTYHDHKFGFFDMYCAEKISIDKVLTREEIINMYINMDSYHNTRLLKFLSLYKLTYDEIKRFKERFKNDRDVQDIIDFYQIQKCNIDEKIKNKIL